MGRMKTIFIGTQKALIVFSLVLAGIMASGTARASDFTIYGAASSFSWEEFNDNGSRLLKESGMISGIGCAYWWKSRGPFTLKPGAEIFGGTVDYTGTTQAGIPSNTTVDYFGVRLKLEAGGTFGFAEIAQLEPFGGFGFSAWLRTINDGTTVNGAKAYGYTENWKTLHMRLGLRARTGLADRARLFVESGVKLPLFNENSFTFNSADRSYSVRLSPGNQTSLFGEAGLEVRQVTMGLFYDGMRFSRSDNERAGGYLIYQPRSTSDLIGIRLGAVF